MEVRKGRGREESKERRGGVEGKERMGKRKEWK